MSDQIPHNIIEEPNDQTAAPHVPQQGNRKAVAGMVLGLVSVIGIGVFPPLIAVGIWFMYWSLVYLPICLWVASAIAGLYFSIAGKNRSRETKSGRGMAITGIVLSCITLALMTAHAIALVLWFA